MGHGSSTSAGSGDAHAVLPTGPSGRAPRRVVPPTGPAVVGASSTLGAASMASTSIRCRAWSSPTSSPSPTPRGRVHLTGSTAMRAVPCPAAPTSRRVSTPGARRGDRGPRVMLRPPRRERRRRRQDRRCSKAVVPGLRGGRGRRDRRGRKSVEGSRSCLGRTCLSSRRRIPCSSACGLRRYDRHRSAGHAPARRWGRRRPSPRAMICVGAADDGALATPSRRAT
jgi:hypothetical protein